jgi:hypothetical protein
MNIIETICEKHQKAVVKCCKEVNGCEPIRELKADICEPPLILKGELFRFSNKCKAADCVIFIEGNPLTLVVVELKSNIGRKGVRHAVEQLQSSLIRTLEVLQECKQWHLKLKIRLFILAIDWKMAYKPLTQFELKINNESCSIAADLLPEVVPEEVPKKYEQSLAAILKAWPKGLCVRVGQPDKIDWSQCVEIVEKDSEGAGGAAAEAD